MFLDFDLPPVDYQENSGENYWTFVLRQTVIFNEWFMPLYKLFTVEVVYFEAGCFVHNRTPYCYVYKYESNSNRCYC